MLQTWEGILKQWIIFKIADLGRMYQLVSKISNGVGQLKFLLEKHIYLQGDSAIKTCGDTAINVNLITLRLIAELSAICFRILSYMLTQSWPCIVVTPHWFRSRLIMTRDLLRRLIKLAAILLIKTQSLCKLVLLQNLRNC